MAQVKRMEHTGIPPETNSIPHQSSSSNIVKKQLVCSDILFLERVIEHVVKTGEQTESLQYVVTKLKELVRQKLRSLNSTGSGRCIEDSVDVLHSRVDTLQRTIMNNYWDEMQSLRMGPNNRSLKRPTGNDQLTYSPDEMNATRRSSYDDDLSSTIDRLDQFISRKYKEDILEVRKNTMPRLHRRQERPTNEDSEHSLAERILRSRKSNRNEYSVPRNVGDSQQMVSPDSVFSRTSMASSKLNGHVIYDPPSKRSPPDGNSYHEEILDIVASFNGKPTHHTEAGVTGKTKSVEITPRQQHKLPGNKAKPNGYIRQNDEKHIDYTRRNSVDYRSYPRRDSESHNPQVRRDPEVYNAHHTRHDLENHNPHVRRDSGGHNPHIKRDLEGHNTHIRREPITQKVKPSEGYKGHTWRESDNHTKQCTDNYRIPIPRDSGAYKDDCDSIHPGYDYHREPHKAGYPQTDKPISNSHNKTPRSTKPSTKKTRPPVTKPVVSQTSRSTTRSTLNKKKTKARPTSPRTDRTSWMRTTNYETGPIDQRCTCERHMKREERLRQRGTGGTPRWESRPINPSSVQSQIITVNSGEVHKPRSYGSLPREAYANPQFTIDRETERELLRERVAELEYSALQEFKNSQENRPHFVNRRLQPSPHNGEKFYDYGVVKEHGYSPMYDEDYIRQYRALNL